jgi:hypothetical protein
MSKKSSTFAPDLENNKFKNYVMFAHTLIGLTFLFIAIYFEQTHDNSKSCFFLECFIVYYLILFFVLIFY